MAKVRGEWEAGATRLRDRAFNEAAQLSLHRREIQDLIGSLLTGGASSREAGTALRPWFVAAVTGPEARA